MRTKDSNFQCLKTHIYHTYFVVTNNQSTQKSRTYIHSIVNIPLILRRIFDGCLITITKQP